MNKLILIKLIFILIFFSHSASAQQLSETGEKVQNRYPGSANFPIEKYAEIWFNINEEEPRRLRREVLREFFQLEDSDFNYEDLSKHINKDLSLIYEFIGKASWLGEEYSLKYPDWFGWYDQHKVTPGFLSGNYFDESGFLINIWEFEKMLLGENADGRWSLEDRQTLVELIQSLDREIEKIKDAKKALGYERTTSIDYFNEDGIFYGINNRKEEIERIRDHYQRMRKLLSFLNYQNLDEVNERLGLDSSGVKFNKKIENLLKAERKECIRLLDILGYETIDGFNRSLVQRPELTTLERLKKEKNSVTDILSRLGFDVDGLRQAISRYRQLNDNPQDYRRLLREEDQQNVWYSRSGKKYEAFNLDLGKNSSSEHVLTLRCIEIPGFPNNFVRTDMDGSIPIERTLERVKNNYARRIFGDGVEMLSLVNESAIEELLLNFKKKLVRLKFNKSEEKLKARIKSRIRQREGKSLFVFGHVEGEQFVTSLDDDGTLRLDISEVIDWGKKYQVNILAFGCDTDRLTGPLGPGTTQFLNSVTDGVDMMKAIQSSRTIGDIFGNYVSDSRKIIINGETFQDQHYFRVRVVKTTATAGRALTIGMVTYLLIDGQNK